MDNLIIKINKIQEEKNKERLFDSFVFSAYLDEELVGYAKLTFIPQTKSKNIEKPIDYLMYRTYGSDDELIKAYEAKDYKYILNKIGLKTINMSSEQLLQKSENSIKNLFNEFCLKIEEDYKSSHKSFYDYWVNKPSIELIRVFTDKDIKVTDYSDGIGKMISRKPLNYQRKGIGLKIYNSILDWCCQNNLSLWASNTQTEDAKKMWKLMETSPKFFLTMTEVLKYSSKGEIMSKTERPFIKIK